MMTRTITFYGSPFGDNEFTINTSAETFGELKNEISSTRDFPNLDWNQTKIFDAENEVMYAQNHQRLPNENFSLFVSPKKMKFGQDDAEEKLRILLEKIFKSSIIKHCTAIPASKVFRTRK